MPAPKKKSPKQSLSQAISIAQKAIERLEERLLLASDVSAGGDEEEGEGTGFGGREIKQLTDLAKLLMEYENHNNKKKALASEEAKKLTDEELQELLTKQIGKKGASPRANPKK